MTRAIFAALTASGLVACSGGASSPTAPTTAALTTELFAGTLAPNGQHFYSFTASDDSAMYVMLASLSTSDARALPDVAVGLGVGIPQGTGCDVKESVTATAGLTRQFGGWVADGIHCVAIYDLGNLVGPVDFAIRLTHY